MLAFLMEGHALTAKSASERFEIEPKPALRNLHLLADCVPGVLVDKSLKEHVFRFEASASGGPIELASQPSPFSEVLSVAIASAFARVFSGSQYHLNLLGLRDRLLLGLPENKKAQLFPLSRKFTVLCGREEVLEDKASLLDSILQAILTQHLAHISYARFDGSEKHDARIKPLSLAVYDSHLYLIGINLDHVDSGPRTFRFSRIQDVEILTERFDYPSPNEYDPDVVFRDSFGIWAGPPNPCNVRVRLSGIWATYASHHQWHSSQRTIPQPDGAVEVAFWVRPCPELEQWILGFGEAAQVLEPADLRARVATRLEAAATRYRLSSDGPES